MAKIVISYGREDLNIIKSVVALLRGAFPNIKEIVFWDGDFEPGKPWHEQFKKHVNSSPRVFIFWCVHSRDSAQVKREFLYAFRRKKRVVPVLLDSTPLHKKLAPIHGIDLRDAVLHTKGTLISIASKRRPETSTGANAVDRFLHNAMPTQRKRSFSLKEFILKALVVEAFRPYLPPSYRDSKRSK